MGYPYYLEDKFNGIPIIWNNSDKKPPEKLPGYILFHNFNYTKFHFTAYPNGYAAYTGEYCVAIFNNIKPKEKATNP